VFVDKTGTLTDGKVHCNGAHGASPVDEARIAILAAKASSLAAWSTHPLSRALHDRFPGDNTVWSEMAEHAAQGIEGRDSQGHLWRLGSARWVGDTATAPADAAKVCLSADGCVVATFDFDERVRSDARAAVQALHADGVEIHLLSGDDADRARRLGAQLGLDSALGALTPEGKLAQVRAAQRRGERVAMLGDGVNDAPVLAQADVSIAMGEGALVARTHADGVLISNKLGDLVRARALARRALRVVRQNLWWAAAYNACCIPLALTGHLPPWAAGLGMACSSLFVITNSMRLAR
jgi:Cu2+-exporting ATPase